MCLKVLLNHRLWINEPRTRIEFLMDCCFHSFCSYSRLPCPSGNCRRTASFHPSYFVKQVTFFDESGKDELRICSAMQAICKVYLNVNKWWLWFRFFIQQDRTWAWRRMVLSWNVLGRRFQDIRMPEASELYSQVCDITYLFDTKYLYIMKLVCMCEL